MKKLSLEELGRMKEYESLFLHEKFYDIQYLTISGSRAYGTNTPDSDIDIRGFYLESKHDLFSIENKKEEITFSESDTVVYSFSKFIKLLTKCNPNIIELIGTREDDIIYTSELAEDVRKNYHIFLSKRVFQTFAGYAISQLRRLENALARDVYTQAEKENHIMQSIKGQFISNDMPEGIDLNGFDFSLENKGDEKEIYVSVDLKHIPLKSLLDTQSLISNTIKNFGKINHRNNKKDAQHLNKHAMHLIRLYYMGIDILENEEIHTYRDKEHDLLMSIRNGEVPYSDIFKIQKELETELHEAYNKSKLPDKPDMKRISEFVYDSYNQYLED